ncbi:MAG: hypothetical protein QM647_18655 [Asticcacaulis sp.]|uniref:hypothetical protein n=1 Tax=Asticcacaulis sp. TaxID=1872648 RepID=UPI0039E64EA4
MRSLPYFLATFTALVTTASAVHAGEPIGLDIILTPQVSGGAVTGLKVSEHFGGTDGATLTVSIPHKIATLLRISDRITRVEGRDANGPIVLKATEGEGQLGTSTLYTTDRPISGDLTVVYDVAVSDEKASGPNWELRAEGQSVSGNGATFLLLPDTEKPYVVHLLWDLSQMAPGARAIDSYDRDPSKQTAPLFRLRQTYFMAGSLVTVPADLSTAGAFRSASLAINNIPQKPLLEWSEKAYGRMAAFFGFPSEPPFTLLLRSNNYHNMSGTAGPEGLIATMSPDTPMWEVDSLIAHESVHVYLNGLMNADDGLKSDDTAWFSEGIAVYYQRQAPFDTGLFTPEEFILDLNDTTRRYYSNLSSTVPMKTAIADFWTDARGRVQPYDRGALYFAVLNGEIRAKSGGKRSLDDLVKAFLKRKLDGQSVELKDWLDLITNELGPEALTEYQAMLDGAWQLPASDAFGPCFERYEEQMPVFELGFAQKSLTQSPRVITDLNPQSPAAKAGVREGDKVIAPVILDPAQSHPEQPINLHIDRGGQILDIHFKPEGPLTKGYLWRLAPANADCQAILAMRP